MRIVRFLFLIIIYIVAFLVMLRKGLWIAITEQRIPTKNDLVEHLEQVFSDFSIDKGIE